MRAIIYIKVKVKGKWIYYYRAIDKVGAIIDFDLSGNRDEPASRVFFDQMILSSGLASKVVIDKSGANVAALYTFNIRLWLSGYILSMIEVLAVIELSNIDKRIVENDNNTSTPVIIDKSNKTLNVFYTSILVFLRVFFYECFLY